MFRSIVLLYIVVLAALPASAWASPAKTQIAYVKGDYVYVSAEDGAVSERISPKGDYSRLRWSPDGKMIACVKTVGERDAPCIIFVDTGKFAQVMDLAYETSVPAWSPDSASIVFSCRAGDLSVKIGVPNPPSTIYTYDTGTQRLSSATTLDKVRSAASAYISAKEIVYADDGKSRLMVFDLANGRAKPVTVVDPFPELNYALNEASFAFQLSLFADTVVIKGAEEAGEWVTAVPVSPGKPSWFFRGLKRLQKSLDGAWSLASDFTPGPDGKSACLLFESLDRSGRSRTYVLDEQGSHLVFQIGGKYGASSPWLIGGGRVLYCRTTRSGVQPTYELRVYEPKLKSSTLFKAGVEQFAVWTAK